MQEYPGGKVYKYIFALLTVVVAGFSVRIILNSQGSALLLVGGLLMLGFCMIGLVAELRSKIILGEDFIEKVYFSRRKIFFKDVIRIIIDNQQTFVISRK